MAAPALAAAASGRHDAHALHALPWLALRTFYREEVVLARSDDGTTLRIPIRPRLETDSLYALRNAALAGLGACIISAWVVEDDLAQGRHSSTCVAPYSRNSGSNFSACSTNACRLAVGTRSRNR